MFKLKIPPPVYALSIAILMWLLNQYLPINHWISTPWTNIGFIIIAVALSFDLWSLFLFLRSKTTPNPMKPENSKHIVTSGLYKISRNPMYVGLSLVLLGYAISLGSITPFLLLPLFVVLITTQQIIPEEEMLEKMFGQEYLDYKMRVRRWL